MHELPVQTHAVLQAGIRRGMTRALLQYAEADADAALEMQEPE